MSTEERKRVKKGKKPKKKFNWESMETTTTASEPVKVQPEEEKDADAIADDLAKQIGETMIQQTTTTKNENKDILDLDFKRTYKRRLKRAPITDDQIKEMFGDIADVIEKPKTTWADGEMTYDDMLSRIMGILRERHSELMGGSKRIVLRPPHVTREGSKKTAFTNFMEICKDLRRDHEHVLAYLLSELGATGSIDSNNVLSIKGRFVSKQIESVLKKYIIEFVFCQGCKSSDTLLVRENRLYFVQCERCGAHRSVSSIKAGFQAQVTRRPRK
ncbi:Domain found in IF2B/IF5 [Carpediemonas membranifera]|uniref:Domain found in IF2B/IF5 n=1 Tax=Carpediemonas membranifera TaxID=201153 RepID=A0A8J6E0A4_9EUKA|nr:Domain found in IF2B/IF5 [Carpediemonas membranifera]|eukprot:KAG9391541.1 Domain found in IF2B/IF5 [Carpediemonas membranifera]